MTSHVTVVPGMAATVSTKPDASSRFLGESRLRLQGSWRPDWFALGLAAIFFLLNLWAVLNHAMWRDEWHVWQITRFSPSLHELFQHCAHFGRPMGWYLLAWTVGKLGFYPWGLKVFHVLISTACIYLVSRYSPFTRLQKILFAFGYFPFYEYGTILRDYAFELLLIVAACAVLSAPRRRPILFGVVLALLFQTTSYGIVIGIALGAAYLFDTWWNHAVEVERAPLWTFVFGGGIAIMSLLTAYWAMKPQVDPVLLLNDAVPKGTVLDRLPVSVAYLWRGYCPVPFQGAWNSNLLDSWPRIQVALALILFVAVLLLFLRRPTALVFFLLGTLAIVGYICTLPLNNVRYHGHYFIILIASCWISQCTRPSRAGQILDWPPFAAWRNQQSAFLVAVLCVHLIVSVIAVVQEQVIPFSGSREAAKIIRQKAPPGIPIIGDCDSAVGAVAAYLDRPAYIAWRREYYPFTDNPDPIRRPGRGLTPMPPAELSESLRGFLAAEKRDVVLVVNYPLSIPQDNKDIQLLGVVNRSINADEQYLIFLVKYRGQ